ncbi:MAG: protein kinase [Cyanosarcina radialis HA8281-LM2]|nr:protein kinase [Cyanosarcina radialis HA8281-LM2]
MLEAGQILTARQQTKPESRYQLQERLGQDASRQTWLAIDLDSQERVIVKLLALNPEMQWDEGKLFEREAQVLQHLEHPRIPRYRNYFVLDRQTESRFSWFVLVESYIPGDSLQQLLDRSKRFSEAEVEKIAVEVLSILAYLHELDPPLVHRDLRGCLKSFERSNFMPVASP